jgi:CheY-like chemotaxis protein
MSERAGADLTGRRVLVVEDEYFIADDLAQTLSRLGAQVVGPIRDRDEALRLVAEGKPIDWAVLDINLRGEMVYPLADALRQRGIPFLFATGYDAQSIAKGYESVPRWEKPFNPASLARALPGLGPASASSSG